MFKRVIKNKIASLNFILICFLFLFSIYPFKFLGFLGVLVCTMLIIYNYKRIKLNCSKEDLKSLLIFISPYFLLLITLVYSDNLDYGFKSIARLLLLFLFPITFTFFVPQKFFSLKKEYVYAFCFSVFIIGCYFFFMGIHLLTFRVPSLASLGFIDKIKLFHSTPFNIPFLWSSREKGILFEHKGYVSIVLNIALLFVFRVLHKINSPKRIIGLLCFTLLIFYFLEYLGSKINILFILIIMTLLIINRLLKIKYRLHIIIIASSCVIVGLLVNPFKTNIGSVVYSEIKKELAKEARYYTWGCSLEVFFKAPIIGHGIGDSQDKLNECYYTLEDYKMLVKEIVHMKLNSHNQYLYFLISGGVVSFGVFVYSIMYFLKRAYTTKDWIFMAIICLFIFNFLTENVLSRIYGVFCFSFIMSFFIKRNKNLSIC